MGCVLFGVRIVGLGIGEFMIMPFELLRKCVMYIG